MMKNTAINLDLSSTAKQLFTFDNDESRSVYIDVADLNITTRVNDIYPKLQQLQEKASKIMGDIREEDEDGLAKMASALKEIDIDMRNLIDELFDAPVSAAAAPSGSMYDLFGGEFRFAIIIECLLKQYTANLDKEAKAMEVKFKKMTTKYSKGKK